MASGRRTVLGVMALATAVLAAACSTGGGQSAQDGAASAASAPATSSLSAATDFRFPLYQGSEHVGGHSEVSLADFEGKALVLNFWAPLCPPCRAEMPDFERLWQEHQDEGLVVLGVDVGAFTGLGDTEQAVEFLQQIGVTYPTGQAASAQILRDYRALGMPTTVSVTRDGGAFKTWSGALNASKLNELADQLLQ